MRHSQQRSCSWSKRRIPEQSRTSTGIKRDKLNGTNVAKFTVFCRFLLFPGIIAFRRRRLSQKAARNRKLSQETADSRRKLQETVDFRRKPQENAESCRKAFVPVSGPLTHLWDHFNFDGCSPPCPCHTQNSSGKNLLQEVFESSIPCVHTSSQNAGGYQTSNLAHVT